MYRLTTAGASSGRDRRRAGRRACQSHSPPSRRSRSAGPAPTCRLPATARRRPHLRPRASTDRDIPRFADRRCQSRRCSSTSCAAGQRCSSRSRPARCGSTTRPTGAPVARTRCRSPQAGVELLLPPAGPRAGSRVQLGGWGCPHRPLSLQTSRPVAPRRLRPRRVAEEATRERALGDEKDDGDRQRRDQRRQSEHRP